jgi:hypothetical protein
VVVTAARVVVRTLDESGVVLVVVALAAATTGCNGALVM